MSNIPTLISLPTRISDLAETFFTVKNNIFIPKTTEHLLIYSKSYLNRSSLGFLKAYKTFKMARNWVAKNKFRFKTDAQTLITSWEIENE